MTYRTVRRLAAAASLCAAVGYWAGRELLRDLERFTIAGDRRHG